MKTMKKCISVLLVVLLTINMLPMQSFATTTENTTEFLGGCGTEEEPYLISTWEHLDNVRNYPDAYYELVCNIEGELEPEAWNSFDFDGHLEGNGYWIQAIINTNEKEEYGLIYNTTIFMINTGTIQNVGMKSENACMSLVTLNQGLISNCYNETNATLVLDQENGGGIAHINGVKGVIVNCLFSGTLTITQHNNSIHSNAGSLVGYNTGRIRLSQSAGKIYVTRDSNYNLCNVGGIAGYNVGTIEQSFNTCEISDNDIYEKGFDYAFGSLNRMGGIAGENSGTIAYCYNLGTITGKDSVGGIVKDNSGSVVNCYNMGDVMVKDTTSEGRFLIGGIAATSTGTISKCYNAGAITSQEDGSDYGVVAGGIKGGFSGNVDNCYNVGNIVVRAEYGDAVAGGISGEGGTAENCYNIGEITAYASWHTGTSKKDGISPSSTKINCYSDVTSMNEQSTYVDFDFENTWFLDSDTGYEYPQLYSNPQVQASEIALITAPTCVEFLEDTIPDLSDGRVKITYADGYEVKRPLKDYMFPGLDNTKVGTQTVTLQYGTCKSTDTLTFNVIAKELVSIDMATLPKKTNYVIGQPFNFSGATVALSYNNDKTVSVPISECEISYGDIQVGIVPITVTYGEFSTTFDMTVREKVMKKITVNVPTKLSYIETQDLDLTGGSVNIIYESEDDYAEQIELTLDMISGYNKNQIGDQTLTVTYEGKTATFVVNVSARSLVSIAWVTKPNKLTYLEAKETLDVTGGAIRTIYDNGATEIIDLTLDMVERFDNTDVGTQQLTVRYGEKRLYYNVEIVAKSLAEIQISQAPSKGVYKINEETVDVSGGKILLIYNNDTTEEIPMTEDMVSDLDTTSAGIKDVVVTYGGKTTSFSVRVIDTIITGEDVTAIIGGTLQVPVYLRNGSGFAYLKLKVEYDTSALQLVSVENQGLVSGMFTTSQNISTNPYVMSWSNASDMQEEGCLVVFNFKVLDDALIGEYVIDITCEEASNENLEDVPFIVEDSCVTICECIFGDVNRDQLVNGKDATLLMQYLAEWNVSLDLLAADVVHDNVINGKDLILLLQYLVGNEVVLGPSVSN